MVFLLHSETCHQQIGLDYFATYDGIPHPFRIKNVIMCTTMSKFLSSLNYLCQLVPFATYIQNYQEFAFI